MVDLKEDAQQIKNIIAIRQQIINRLECFMNGLNVPLTDTTYTAGLTEDDLLIRIKLLAKIRDLADEVSQYIR